MKPIFLSETILEKIDRVLNYANAGKIVYFKINLNEFEWLEENFNIYENAIIYNNIKCDNLLYKKYTGKREWFGLGKKKYN